MGDLVNRRHTSVAIVAIGILIVSLNLYLLYDLFLGG